jgi:hypothetical protein
MARARLFAGVGLLLFALGAHAGEEENPASLLRKSMGRRFSVNILAVIRQRDPGGNGSYQRIKVSRSSDGRIRQTILQPLRMAGIDRVDDGDTIRVYLPDKKSLIIQDSVQASPKDVDERMRLAKRNYDFAWGESCTIAGRKSLCVVVKPRHGGMTARRYYLDEHNGYPLRLEVLSGPQSDHLVFDTLAVEYPKKLASAVFDLDPLPGTLTYRYSRPKTLKSDNAEKLLGFQPILPGRLPLGFELQEMQINENKDWKSAAVRLTDGIVRATVYQWRPNGQPVESVEESSSLDVGGIRLLLVSDLPAAVRMRLLQAFVPRAEVEVEATRGRVGQAMTNRPSTELLRWFETFSPLKASSVSMPRALPRP